MSDPNNSQYPQYTPPAGPSQASAKKTNGLGIAALIVGIVGFIVCCIPFAVFFGLPLVIVGLVLGIIGLVLKDRAKGIAIAGTIVSGVGLIIGIIMTAFTVSLASTVSTAMQDFGIELQELSEQIEARANEQHTVVLEVTGTAPTASVSYNFKEGDDSKSESNDEMPLPFRFEYVSTGFDIYSVSASSTVEGDLTCRITVDGEVVNEDHSSGDYQLVVCIGS